MKRKTHISGITGQDGSYLPSPRILSAYKLRGLIISQQNSDDGKTKQYLGWQPSPAGFYELRRNSELDLRSNRENHSWNQRKSIRPVIAE